MYAQGWSSCFFSRPCHLGLSSLLFYFLSHPVKLRRSPTILAGPSDFVSFTLEQRNGPLGKNKTSVKPLDCCCSHFTSGDSIKINTIVCNESPVAMVVVMKLRLEFISPDVVFCLYLLAALVTSRRTSRSLTNSTPIL